MIEKHITMEKNAKPPIKKKGGALFLNLRLALVLLPTAHGPATAGCSDPQPAVKSLYVRQHRVQNFNDSAPDLLEDSLTLWVSKSGDTCFALETLGPNGHECGAMGVLDRVSDRKYRFNAGVCSINLTLNRGSAGLVVASTWRRWGAGGVCPQKFGCGMFGAVESGRFMQR